MPYADPAKRRDYNTAYKRARRAAQANPLKGFRLYICPRFPNIQVGGGSFVGGFLITNRKEIQAAVERQHDFLVHIFPVPLGFPRMDDE